MFIKENHYNKLMRIIIFIIGVISMFGFLKKNNISNELREKLNSNDSIIIDVREENEVVEGHIEKAKWLPFIIGKSSISHERVTLVVCVSTVP